MSRFYDTLRDGHFKVDGMMDRDVDGNANYDATRYALTVLNRYLMSLGMEGRHLLRSSYLGNDKLVVAKDMDDKLWVASHNILRDYTGVVGDMLDTGALTKALPLQVVSERLAEAQTGYHKAVLAILEDAGEALRKRRVLEWSGGVNSRGQPIIDSMHHLSELKKKIVTPNHRVLWKRYEEANAAMGDALSLATHILEQQPNVPLTWVDARNVTHHQVLDKTQFPDSGAVCVRLYLLGCIAKWGQINSLTVSDSAAEILKKVGQTSDVFANLDSAFLEKLQQVKSDPLKQYLHEALVGMRSMHELEKLRVDPVAQASFNTAYLKEAFDALHLSEYPVQPPKRAGSAAARRHEGCPVTGARAGDDEAPSPKDKHWCVQVLEGCQNIPAQHGYGPYR